MKNLLQRLRPEIVKNIYNGEEQFPILVEDILKKLSENVAITEMKLGDLTNIANFSPNHVSTILEIYDMFENS
jgi:hypothetical protein